MASRLRINLPQNQLNAFSRRWKVKELALFGSVLRDDFRPDSDIDVLIQFTADARWSLFDLVTMQDELEKIFGRKVDMIELEGLRNPFRRRSILNNLEVVYGSPRA